MKKSLIAIAILSSSATVNAVEIYNSDEGTVNFYGQLRTELKFLDNNDHKADLSSGSSRAGVNGTYALSNNIDVLGKVEFGLRDNSDVNVRQHILGFSSQYGTVKLGKQWTISDDVYGADYSYFFGGSALRYSTLNGALHDSQVKYSYDSDNYWIKVGVGLNENEKNQDLYEVYTGTSIGDLDLHAGVGFNKDYNSTSDLIGTVAPTQIKNEFYQLTAEYNRDDLLVGFTYFHSNLSTNLSSAKIKENGYSLAGKYKVTEKTSIYTGYELTAHDLSGVNGEFIDDSKVIYLGSEYKFDDKFRTYVEYGYGNGTTFGYNNDDRMIKPQTVDSVNNFAAGARFYW